MIGYYVHHQGDGHLQRAVRIARTAPDHFVLIGTSVAGRTQGMAFLELEDDRPDRSDFDGDDGLSVRPDALHYAPYHHDGVRGRTARVANWIAASKPALMVVDVSVEMALLARLCATPVVTVRLSGDRSDPAHLNAFAGSEALLAPFHARLDDSAPDWVRARTTYFAPRAEHVREAGAGVFYVHGRGGPPLDGRLLAQAASATPDRVWTAVGPVIAPDGLPSNLRIEGWVDDVASRIMNAGVVIGGAGDGLVDAVLSGGRPFVCLPEARAYDEQVAKARALARCGAAVVLASWPEPSAWPGVLAEAQALEPTARDGLTGAGIDAAGPWLMDLADALGRPR
jgi:hypothetical protein